MPTVQSQRPSHIKYTVNHTRMFHLDLMKRKKPAVAVLCERCAKQLKLELTRRKLQKKY
jgi:hypothetical protein